MRDLGGNGGLALLRRAAVRLTFLMRARRRCRGLRRIIGKPCRGLGSQRFLDAGLVDALLKQIACAKPQPNRFLIQGKRLVQGQILIVYRLDDLI